MSNELIIILIYFGVSSWFDDHQSNFDNGLKYRYLILLARKFLVNPSNVIGPIAMHVTKHEKTGHMYVRMMIYFNL